MFVVAPISAPSLGGLVESSITSKKPTVVQIANTLLRVVTLLKIFDRSWYFTYGGVVGGPPTGTSNRRGVLPAPPGVAERNSVLLMP